MFKLVSVVILLAAAVGLGRRGYFKVRHIDCRLNHYPCPLQLEPVLLSFVGRNIFSLSSGSVSRQIMSFDPTLTEIKISKRLPSRLLIDLGRRLPVAAIKVEPDGPRFYLDKTGFVYLPPTLVNQPLVEVIWPKELSLVEGESVLSLDLARLVNTLAAYYVTFSQIIRQTDETYLVKTVSGPEALILAGADFAPAVASLQFILSNIKIGEPVPTKIDLRFDKPILTY
ncbi:hypothetical protein CO018_01130 [Candidatus Beckwithbacteria bacterium CG_4_9_14_0_2_um_filter_47_11]|uniref:POTRA domain-containing protein n=1 Tax=Candidatus Beckwithbacteria bacterium CG_4_9_14_0_2_um_filter_47_11 TaxID=1974494 RepID=A0A2M8G4L8_9BACT|nr:MAG: hypothetical protein CO018_01130 [Candidatus Beckwithbacteria bacterium CG_4_9_14_0_2_um_filter_47_11]